MCRWSGSAAAPAGFRSIRSPECDVSTPTTINAELAETAEKPHRALRVLRRSSWSALGLAALVLVSADAAAGRDLAVIDAVRNADGDALRALLRKKADVNVAEADGTTALHWASYADDLETVDLLIRAGALVNAANDLGVTPLWTASLNGSAAMVRRLLAAGANPNAALLLGETPVMVAARSGNAEVVEMLLAKGANANARAA